MFKCDSLFPIKVLSQSLLICMLILNVIGCTNSQKTSLSYSLRRDLTSSSYYQVKKGDTLYSIGFRSGHGYKRIAQWNNISSPYTLYIGQKIQLSSRAKRQTKKKIKIKKSTISTNNKKIVRLHWKWPVRGRILRNFYRTGKKGIDIAGKIGQKIKATESGVVVYSGSGLIGYGKLLIIKHNYLYLSAYAHNRRLLVKEGQQVKKGQVIAEMGIGINAKPSLHFEIRKNGKPVNPVKYLEK